MWEVVPIGLEVDVRQDADPGRGHHAEHHETGAAEHHLRHRLDQRGHLRQQAEYQHDDAATRGHPARAHPGHADEAHVLRE